jgi:hypothetical protein
LLAAYEAVVFAEVGQVVGVVKVEPVEHRLSS